MNKNTFSFKNTPGWLVILGLYGVLYVTGLHTEAIAQVQRLLLATGVKNANVPEIDPVTRAIEKPGTVMADNAKMAGAGFQMMDLKGNVVSFESLKGKVVFLNIWATWCPPCIAEMPNIQKLHNKVNSENISFVMLSMDEGGMEKVKKFIRKRKYTFPVYMPASPLPKEFYSNSIPTTFIISPEGKVVARQEGMADYNTAEVQEFLKSMLRK